MKSSERKNFSWLSDWTAFYTRGSGGARGLYQGALIFSLLNSFIQRCILSRLLSEIQNDVGILIEIEDGKVFLGIDDDGILS